MIDQFTASMKMIALTLAALVAVAAAVPATPSIHADIYKNILTPETSRIVGGEEASRGQFTYQVSIRWGILGSASHICGGSLIKENWVLTAAHCKAYPFGTYDVVLGLLNQEENHPDVQIIPIAEFIVHSAYPGGVAPNDIALIRLETAATLNDAVQLVPLATGDECGAIEDVLLSGWGLTSPIPIPPVGLRWAQLPRISNEQCAADLTALLGSSEPLDDSMICTTANEDKTQSACSGDSGGPLALESLGKQVGVVSWGISPCGTKGAPSVYTSVCSHADFINSHIEN